VARKATRIVREYEESAVPEDAVQLDPDALRAAELEAAAIPEDEITEIFRVTDEMRTTGGVVLQFVRVLPVTIAGYCGEMVPAEFTLERVRKEFGVGTYRVRVMGPKGFVPGGGKLIIAPLPEKPIAPESSVADVLAILKADKESSGAKFKEWAVVLTPLLAPVISSWLTPKNQVGELVQGLAALKGLEPEREKAPSLAQQLDQLTALLAKAKELLPENASATGATWIDLLRDGIASAKPVLEGLAQRALGGVPPRPGIPMMGPVIMPPAQLPGPAVVSPSAPVPSSPPASQNGGAGSAVPVSGTEPVGVVSLLPWLSAMLQQLIVRAGKNRDPELYAEVTLDNVPDGIDPKQLIPFLERVDWWQQLVGFAPAVMPYPSWFQEYRDALLTMLKEAPAPTPGGPAEPTTEFEGDGM
jgi:hypothetical protein